MRRWGLSRLQWIFLFLFLLASFYVLFVETERYESSTIVSLKDLSQKQEVSLGAMLLGQSTEVVKDSNILQLYMRSLEMYRHLDTLFHLSDYYTSPRLDPLRRLYRHALLPQYRATRENFLARYNEDLKVEFDTISQTLTIRFAHADPEMTEKILREIIRYSDETINRFSRESARISLEFISKQVEANRKKFIQAIRKLIDYQTRNRTFDPELDVERINTILAELQAELTKKEVEYQSKKRTGWNLNSLEMKTLLASIRNIKSSIEALKRKLSGRSAKGEELNVNVFEFQILKNEMEFAKEVYKQTLINQERLKMEVSQNAKHIVTITPPYKPQMYKYPEKFRSVLTIMIGLLMIYLIIRSFVVVLREHVD